MAGSLVVAMMLGPWPASADDEPGVVPHGCASVSSDYSVALDPLARHVAVKVNSNEPCTFRYAHGDIFSGSGRFSVTCSTGGYYHHPDDLPSGDPNPPVIGLAIPQPCAVGATVTLNGYHPFTGGSVVGGGLSAAPSAPTARFDQAEFHELCDLGSEPAATVELHEPVNRSGLLTYIGTVRCDGTKINITSLTVTPLAGYSYPSAGTASCANCKRPLSLTGTVPAIGWLYEVELSFDVTARGKPTVSGSRLGRYIVGWAGDVNTICPGVELDPLADDTTIITVPGEETCPV